MKHFLVYAMLFCAPISLCAMGEESEITLCELVEMQLRSIKGIAHHNVDEMWKRNRRFNDFVHLLREARFAQLDGKPWDKKNELEDLIKQGLDVNGEFLHEGEVRTLLYITTECSDIDRVRFLLAHGAAKSITHTPQGQDMTPLRWATFHNDVAILKLFFDHNISITLDQEKRLSEEAQEKDLNTAAQVKALINEYCAKQKETSQKAGKHGDKKPAATADDEKKSTKKK